MSELSILVIGKMKSPLCAGLEEEYFKRLKHYTKSEIIILKDSAEKLSEKKTKSESDSILKHIFPTDTVIVMDEKGVHLTSVGLAEEIKKWNNAGTKKIVFIVGGPYGLSDEVKKRAKKTLALSTMTLPHELARVLLLEQLYRAYTIIKGEKYHH